MIALAAVATACMIAVNPTTQAVTINGCWPDYNLYDQPGCDTSDDAPAPRSLTIPADSHFITYDPDLLNRWWDNKPPVRVFFRNPCPTWSAELMKP